jgi:exopolyphosphatase/guanosine-5'-triphosphate,3'-diphosphate pyrophosphatase
LQRVERAECTRARLRVLAVATASVRDAPNAHALVDKLPTLGVAELRVLSGVEEAQLGAEAALRTRPLREGAVVDLGGGSMQWSSVRGGRLTDARSLPLGAARLTREFLRSDPAQACELEALRATAREHLRRNLPRALLQPQGSLLVLGGTARALARPSLRRALQGAGGRYGVALRLSELRHMREQLARLTVEERKRLPGMRPERADIIVAGALVLEQLLEQSGYSALTVCAASVREGVLWREARRFAALT